MVEELEEKKEEAIETSTTRFDERRKELINTKTEERKTDLGLLKIRTEGIYHEEGIKKVLKDLYAQKKISERNLEIIQERLGPTPEMTPELKELEENLQKINLINYKKKVDEKGIKKDENELKNNEENLKRINKDINEIKSAIGSRLNLED
jgi:hypothetical protein